MLDGPYYRLTTEGSIKWWLRHNVGCVFQAPWYCCICREFPRVIDKPMNDGSGK